MYPDDKVEQEEGWSADLTLTQKADYMADIGKTEEALRIYQTTLEMKSREMGEKGRGTQNVKRSIGYVLYRQHKFDEALEVLNHVLEIQIESHGSPIGNMDIQETRLCIANVLESQGKLPEALELYEQVYESFVEFCGAEVDLTAHVGFNMTSLKLKVAASTSGKDGLDLETILKVVDYGPTVLSLKTHGEDGKDTVLHRAVKTNIPQIIDLVFKELLTKCEGDKKKLKEFLNFENSEVQTPLTLAVKYECENAVKYLLEHGIKHGLDVNKITGFTNNPLLLASYGFNETIKNLLLQYNAVMPVPT